MLSTRRRRQRKKSEINTSRSCRLIDTLLGGPHPGVTEFQRLPNLNGRTTRDDNLRCVPRGGGGISAQAGPGPPLVSSGAVTFVEPTRSAVTGPDLHHCAHAIAVRGHHHRFVHEVEQPASKRNRVRGLS